MHPELCIVISLVFPEVACFEDARLRIIIDNNGDSAVRWVELFLEVEIMAAAEQ